MKTSKTTKSRDNYLRCIWSEQQSGYTQCPGQCRYISITLVSHTINHHTIKKQTVKQKRTVMSVFVDIINDSRYKHLKSVYSVGLIF